MILGIRRKHRARDYVSKYPNAGQIGQSGIWNTPNTLDANSKNNYTLIHPWGTPVSTSHLSGIGGGKLYACPKPAVECFLNW